MWRLEQPAIDALDLYQSCIGGMRDMELANRLRNNVPFLEPEYDAYVHAAELGQLHTIPIALSIGLVTGAEMGRLYKNRMVDADSPGRPAYDRIMAAAANKKCPLCGHRRVSTLDHHLPQSRFAALTVFPPNLVAACRDCNTTKRHLVHEVQDTMHPYFDDVESVRWLGGRLIEGTPPVMVFGATPPETMPVETRARIRHHFSTLELGALYALEAADEIMVANNQVKQVLRTGDANAVRAHLSEEATILEQTRPNWWRTIVYECLAASDWYCSGNAVV